MLDIDQILASLQEETELQRRSSFLRYINNFVISFLFITLIIDIINRSYAAFVIILITLLFTLFVQYLNKKGKVNLASVIFCYIFNISLDAIFIGNAFLGIDLLPYGMILATTSVVAVYLMGNRGIVIFTLINIVVVVATFIARFGFQYSILESILPIIGFILLLSLVSWFHQRTLKRAQQRYEVAQHQLMRDAMLRQEVVIARDLQRQLYPDPPQQIQRVSFSVCALPALETSGDLYDFIQLDERRIGIVIADVTGKSMAAALVMVMARSSFRSEGRNVVDPGQVLSNVNSILHNDSSVKQMITAWYGVLDVQSMTLVFANAGHPFPLLYRDGQTLELEALGLPLRATPGLTYESATVQLLPGDHLLLLTDGVIEAMNAQRELFGYERLTQVFTASVDGATATALELVQDEITRFSAPAPQADDITMVLVSIH